MSGEIRALAVLIGLAGIISGCANGALETSEPVLVTEEVIRPSAPPIATVTSTPAPTETKPPPTPTADPASVAVSNECLFISDPPLPDSTYAFFGFDYGQCRLLPGSPDGSMLFYLTLEKNDQANNPIGATVVLKGIRIDETEPYEIYRSRHFTITDLSWASDGRLVITDRYAEGFQGSTAIYDPAADQVTHTFTGIPYSSSAWNPFDEIVYAIEPDGVHAQICGHQISGFHFDSDREFPSLGSLQGSNEKLLLLSEPFWENRERLYLNFRTGRHDASLDDYMYGPAQVAYLDFAVEPFEVVLEFSDPQTDYFVSREGEGAGAVSEASFEARTCRDLFFNGESYGP